MMNDVIYILEYYKLPYVIDLSNGRIWKSDPTKFTHRPNSIIYNECWLSPEDHSMPFIASLFAYFTNWTVALEIYNA
jgi:hypothetical protein